MRSVRYLHRGQARVLRDPSRFRFVCCGRGWGKTHVAIADALDGITGDPRARAPGNNHLTLYVGPTRNQVREIAWEWLKQEVPEEWLKRKPNETLLEMEFRWGPRLRLVGADKLRSRRGLSVNKLIADEEAFMRDGVWTVLRPTLRTPQDRALIITTPNGPNHAFDLWNRTRGVKGWSHYQMPTWENPYHDPDIIEEARHTLSRIDFDQEYGASFAALKGAVYSDFSQQRNVLQFPRSLDLNREVYVGQDYNGGNYNAVIGQPHGDEIVIVAEVVTRSSIWDHAENLKRWLRANGVRDEKFYEQVIICADTSGDYNMTQKGGHAADNTIMRKAGFNVRGDKQNPMVEWRISAVQGLILNAAGEVRLKINPTCTELIRCLLNQTWNQWGKPDKVKGLDHLPDALGYLVHQLKPVRGPSFARVA